MPEPSGRSGTVRGPSLVTSAWPLYVAFPPAVRGESSQRQSSSSNCHNHATVPTTANSGTTLPHCLWLRQAAGSELGCWPSRYTLIHGEVRRLPVFPLGLSSLQGGLPVADLRTLRGSEELDKSLLAGGAVVARKQHRIALLAAQLWNGKRQLNTITNRVQVLAAHLARLQVGDDHDQSVLQLLDRVVLHQAGHLRKSGMCELSGLEGGT